MFHSRLYSHFLSTYNDMSMDIPTIRDTSRAQITIIPKPDMDPLYCPNYRPISLLNADLKLLTKILVNRLTCSLKDNVHLDGVGFIPSREARDSVARVLDVINKVQTDTKTLMFLSTYAKNPFKRLDWTFLERTLQHIGISSHMLS